MASDKVLTIDDSNFESTVAEGVTLVDFWAPWCGPCRMVAPIIDKVADALDGVAKVGKCNTDEAGTSAQKFNVASIPTLLIMKDGEVKETLVGAAQKEAVLVEKIKSYL
ncbi:MAG: thioredoxin [Lentisphaeraceae bacterium]|nr:thioredoxin [Lentisphaeraceae bacterium]